MEPLRHTPKVTVLMTVFNGSQYLKKAVDSVLSQTFEDFEFLIIDDCSIDNSVEIIKSYTDVRIQLIKNENNLGQTASLNMGLKFSKGEYIARIDQDDVSMPDRLKKQVKFLNNNLNVVAVGSFFTIIGSDGNSLLNKKLPVGSDSNLFYIITGHNPLIHPGVLFRKKVIVELGCYREEYMPSEDIDLWLRLYQNSYVCDNIPEYLTCIRRHTAQVSINNLDEQNNNHTKAFYNFYTEVTKCIIDYHKIEQYFNVSVWRTEKVNLKNIKNIITVSLNLFKRLKWSNKRNNSTLLKFYNIRLFQLFGLIKLGLRSNIYSIIRSK